MKSLWVDAQLCTGCSQCVLACSFEKESHFSPADALLTLLQWEDRGFTQPLVCTQCEDAPCVEACSTQALFRDPFTGAVVIDQTLCSDCGLCVEACPTGVVFIHSSQVQEDRRRTGQAVKCDLCGGQPACVAVCPWQALTLEDKPWPEFKLLRDNLERVREAALCDREPEVLVARGP